MSNFVDKSFNFVNLVPVNTEKRDSVLAAATQAFLRHGFRRVTMGEIAERAALSRPALYLVFRNKEEIFKAALRRLGERASAQILDEIPLLDSPAERLRFAFEVWTVRPYELIRQYPEARDLVSPRDDFSRATHLEVQRAFEEIVVGILASGPGGEVPAVRDAARMLATASVGFQDRARSTRELRTLIGTAVDATVAWVAAGQGGLDPSAPGGFLQSVES